MTGKIIFHFINNTCLYFSISQTKEQIEEWINDNTKDKVDIYFIKIENKYINIKNITYFEWSDQQ
jgi:hypothetical protein